MPTIPLYLVLSVADLEEMTREARREAKLRGKQKRHTISIRLEAITNHPVDGAEQVTSSSWAESLHNLRRSNDEFASILKEGAR